MMTTEASDAAEEGFVEEGHQREYRYRDARWPTPEAGHRHRHAVSGQDQEGEVMGQIDAAEIEKRFTHHVPGEKRTPIHTEARALFKEFAA
jgi:hypothetical protein